jgi:hypothetical protein
LVFIPGDIIIDDNDIFGDGVNIASRLEGTGQRHQSHGCIAGQFEDGRKSPAGGIEAEQGKEVG